MARIRTPTTTPKPQPKVVCINCRHFVRDTSGISHNIETGEFFMGICSLGLHPDSTIKQFANKPRICTSFKNNKQQ